MYYSINRWRQERLIRQAYKQIYGVDVGKIGGIPGVPDIVPGKMMEEILKEEAKQQAKEEARQKKEEAIEAAKTPRDKFNEAKESVLKGEIAAIFDNKIKSAMEKVFDKTKVSEYFRLGDSGEGMMINFEVMVPQIVSDGNFDKLVEEFTNRGYKIVWDVREAGSAGVTMGKNGEGIQIGYSEEGGQKISVSYTKE